jgi:hypothetical protein
MNERIRQLAEQATSIVEMVGPQGYASSYANFDKEKFAELIVRECAEVGSKFSQAHPLDIQYQIKRYFGVEE